MFRYPGYNMSGSSSFGRVVDSVLAHPSGTLISHRLPQIISPQPNNTGHRPIFVGCLSKIKTLCANFCSELCSVLFHWPFLSWRNHVKPWKCYFSFIFNKKVSEHQSVLLCVQIYLRAFGRVAAWSSVENGVRRPGVWLCLRLARWPRLLTALGPDQLGWSFGGKWPEVASFLILYPPAHCKCEISGCQINWIRRLSVPPYGFYSLFLMH